MGPNRGGGRQARRGAPHSKPGPPAAPPAGKAKGGDGGKKGRDDGLAGAHGAVVLSAASQRQLQGLLEELGPPGGDGLAAPGHPSGRFEDVNRKVRAPDAVYLADQAPQSTATASLSTSVCVP